MAVTDCRHFNGYKPCGKNETCSSQCPHKDIPSSRLLLIHLGALGAVVRSTALLAPIRRKFPRAHITWVTDAPAHKILQGHQGIDRVLTTSDSDLLALSALEFDVAFVIDKSLKAAGVLTKTKVDLVYGFTADPRTGAILPATAAAEELWSLGLDNHKKFHVNRKSEIQLVTEALELGPYRKDEYWLPLNTETALRDRRRVEWSKKSTLQIVGLNTGCSNVIAAKKLSVEAHREMIRRLLANPNLQIVLLGGPEDTIRNQQIAEGFPSVIASPTEAGLRDGYASVAACDVVLTGDSLGMHMAIAAKVWTVAWFGPTCAHEIELYGRGEHILSSAPCAPCWKRVCDKTRMCYDQVDLASIEDSLQRGLKACLSPENSSLSSKPLFLATSSSASDC